MKSDYIWNNITIKCLIRFISPPEFLQAIIIESIRP